MAASRRGCAKTPGSSGAPGAATRPALFSERHGYRKRWLATVLVVVTSVVGCTVSPRGYPPVDRVGADEHGIAVTSEVFGSTKPIGLKYTDTWQTEEYARFRAGGRQLEMIYATASRASTVALDYQLPIEAMVSTWNFNAGRHLVWGPLGRVDNRLGTWFYRIYAHRDSERSCVGFLVEWDTIYEDPQGRPGKVAFGYYCGSGGETLTDEAVRSLILGIRIGMSGGRSATRYHADDSTGEKGPGPIVDDGLRRPPAMDTARGYGLPAGTGNLRFPFMFARYYGTSDGGKIH